MVSFHLARSESCKASFIYIKYAAKLLLLELHSSPCLNLLQGFEDQSSVNIRCCFYIYVIYNPMLTGILIPDCILGPLVSLSAALMIRFIAITNRIGDMPSNDTGASCHNSLSNSLYLSTANDVYHMSWIVPVEHLDHEQDW